MNTSALQVQNRTYRYYSLQSPELAERIRSLPFSLKILAENLIRRIDMNEAQPSELESLLNRKLEEITFQPMRVVLQDFTGVPVLVDLATLKEEAVKAGGKGDDVKPRYPTDLVIDHSVQLDHVGAGSLAANSEIEFERNQERYQFLKWSQHQLGGLSVIPPENGIVHQVNLEYLAKVISEEQDLLYFDTVVGTDSHTTMINGLGVLGWGVGGIEAEAAMLGQPIPMLIPKVVGVRLEGKLADKVCATDLVLNLTELLRKHGVVGKFVEFFGPSLGELSLPDRATLSNMAPEYGATCGLFPIDEQTLNYLKLTGREEHQIATIEAYAKAQGLFGNQEGVVYDETVVLNLSEVRPALAGPKRPQDRIDLNDVSKVVKQAITGAKAPWKEHQLQDGAVVIASITSCTNTSNPSVLLGAGILAQKAHKLGLQTKPWVKASLAPGSKAVTYYLDKAGLLEPLSALGFEPAAYGCATCIGNSGPLNEGVSEVIQNNNLTVSSVLSGNRNFEGRVHPDVKLNFLASPYYVVAYALAGRSDIDWQTEPVGIASNGQEVFLSQILPSQQEIAEAYANLAGTPFKAIYEEGKNGGPLWQAIDVPKGERYDWSEDSTYIQRAPFFELEPPKERYQDARVLAYLGDSITTDHISPAGVIKPESAAGEFLIGQGVQPKDFNSYGTRRGNHHVMVRGTLANIRLQNKLAKGKSGGYTCDFTKPDAPVGYIYDASRAYESQGTPLVILAGAEYGSGSSRDWAAKGVRLLGVRIVIAKSYERIHRSNLIGMGVLPLEFNPSQDAESLGLSGEERFQIEAPFGAKTAQITAISADGSTQTFEAKVRVDTPKEWAYYQAGGLLPFVLNRLTQGLGS